MNILSMIAIILLLLCSYLKKIYLRHMLVLEAAVFFLSYIHYSGQTIYRQRDRQTDRQPDRETDRQTDRQTVRVFHYSTFHCSEWQLNSWFDTSVR